ncbi:hNH endonuclease, partial [Escherichia coli]|nr:hNH endonuclease [Escherichia coli]EHB8456126.1 hNH endonuclease [Escherichia coli]
IESKLETALRECRSAGITIDNLEAKCAALAAENAGMKKFCKDAAFDADYEAELGMERGGFSDALNEIKTPATDAFMAEVRAQCLNAFIQHHSAELDAHIKNGGEQFDEKSVRIRDIIVSARLFREQIRKGAAL